ncbi:MAG: 5-formyltetrahydrofolate cyclo-ligase, partial [Hymenobacteraceae bacterium]|nr:5-formyltetrahydrofolate cyclo-ligase [Hymenobacteraceae bacterium]MDX5512854.1 5-formyltetrahydrofolate cyclo-ligase [Hymenobacteraceae bacterium]
FDACELVHYQLTPHTKLYQNHWGITEPVGAAPVADSEIDLVLTPLLAVDMAGHRVGYGKGYYDRFFARLPKNALKIGLSLEPPIPAILDVHEADIGLDAVITPDRIFHFSGSGN